MRRRPASPLPSWKKASRASCSPREANEIRGTVALVHAVLPKLALSVATVTAVRPLGMGDRVCLDTVSNMVPGEGMLVGNAGSGFFLVHSESLENPYVAARPFRVNAGAVHAYLYLPEGKTKYLSEVKAGDEVLTVRHDGTTSVSNRPCEDRAAAAAFDRSGGGGPAGIAGLAERGDDSADLAGGGGDFRRNPEAGRPGAGARDPGGTAFRDGDRGDDYGAVNAWAGPNELGIHRRND